MKNPYLCPLSRGKFIPLRGLSPSYTRTPFPIAAFASKSLDYTHTVAVLHRSPVYDGNPPSPPSPCGFLSTAKRTANIAASLRYLRFSPLQEIRARVDREKWLTISPAYQPPLCRLWVSIVRSFAVRSLCSLPNSILRKRRLGNARIFLSESSVLCSRRHGADRRAGNTGAAGLHGTRGSRLPTATATHTSTGNERLAFGVQHEQESASGGARDLGRQ